MIFFKELSTFFSLISSNNLLKITYLLYAILKLFIICFGIYLLFFNYFAKLLGIFLIILMISSYFFDIFYFNRQNKKDKKNYFNNKYYRDAINEYNKKKL